MQWAWADGCCMSPAMYRLSLNTARPPLKLTCALTTVRSEDVDVLNVAIWLEQGPQLLLGDIPGDLHRSEGLSWSSDASSNTRTTAGLPHAGTIIVYVMY